MEAYDGALAFEPHHAYDPSYLQQHDSTTSVACASEDIFQVQPHWPEQVYNAPKANIETGDYVLFGFTSASIQAPQVSETLYESRLFENQSRTGASESSVSNTGHLVSLEQIEGASVLPRGKGWLQCPPGDVMEENCPLEDSDSSNGWRQADSQHRQPPRHLTRSYLPSIPSSPSTEVSNTAHMYNPPAHRRQSTRTTPTPDNFVPPTSEFQVGRRTSVETPCSPWSSRRTSNASVNEASSPGASESGRLVCGNCTTQVTPLWRRDANGDPLCNACGLFLKLHGVMRPMSLRTDIIKKRNRTSAAKTTGGKPARSAKRTSTRTKGDLPTGDCG